MRVVHERCCGIDVHKKVVVACVVSPQGQETKTFGATTKELLLLADWLRREGVTHAAMESTGVYWKPVYNLLEGEFTVWVVNAQHLKAVPGRKTDVKDAEWIADLLAHGLLKPSFIPERPQRELRELVRYRRSLIEEHTREVNRLQKVLEGANIKLSSVASDVVGVSGLAMLSAIAAGVKDPQALADLAKGRLREKRGELEEALCGVVGEHQRLLIKLALEHLAFLGAQVAALDEEVARRMGPFEEAIQRLDGIPGIGRRGAEAILAESGTNMARFPTGGQFASWAGTCPGNRQSAGKRRRAPALRGNRWLRTALVEAAQAASHTKTYLAAQYHRIAARRGARRAILAVAHTIAEIIHALLSRGTAYTDLGPNYFDERDRQATLTRSVRRIERLGYKVILEAA
jgi:transposase